MRSPSSSHREEEEVRFSCNIQAWCMVNFRSGRSVMAAKLWDEGCEKR